MDPRRTFPRMLALGTLIIALLVGTLPASAATLAGAAQTAASAPKATAATPGNVYTWGANSCGQLGDGTQDVQLFVIDGGRCDQDTSLDNTNRAGAATYDDRSLPGIVNNLGQVTAIAAGQSHVLAVTVDGGVYAWGANGYGRLGIGQNDGSYAAPLPVVAPCPSTSPAPVTPGACGYLSGMVAVAAGYEHSLALRGSDGAVFAWGSNADGQLSNPTATLTEATSTTRPVQVMIDANTPLTGIVAIQAGIFSSYALSSDGTVWAWGDGTSGQLGNNTILSSTYAVQVLTDATTKLSGITAIATEATSTAAIPPDHLVDQHVVALQGNTGAVFAWGTNINGQLGNGDVVQRNVATPARNADNSANLTGASGIAAGSEFSAAIIGSGTNSTVYAWGANGSGQLGNGITNNTPNPLPVQVLGVNGTGVLTGIAQLTGGASHALAITTAGTVVAWGSGGNGQIGDGLNNNPTTSPRVVRSADNSGQFSGVSAIAGGENFSVAIAAATITTSASNLTFGSQPVGMRSTVQNAILTNGGGGPLSVTGVTITGANAGDFNLVGGCPAIVMAGATCAVGVAFAPTAVGARAATLTFATSAGSLVVTLAGTGTTAPPSTFTVTASIVGSGTITPVGVSNYTGGTLATYTAVPAAGQVFLGWTLDGTYVGYPTPFDFTVNANRTLVATFAPRPAFSDVPTTDGDFQAITFLAAFGIVNPQSVNGSGQFQPARAVVRAEMAAFIARTFGWDKEFHRNNFPDRCDPQSANCIDDELWNNVAALADYAVVGGYTDAATCASAGTNAPCYLPRDQVIKLQVVSIVARAFIKTPSLRPTGIWDRLAANAGQYTNVPDAGTQRSDLTTYRANAGAIPGQTTDATFPGPNDAASRRFVIATLYQAFNAVYSVDRTP